MQIAKAKKLVKEKMAQYGLTDWTFEFSNAKRQHGYCSSGQKLLVLSKPLTKLNDEARVTNTILHEIAHALVGTEHKHDEVWEAKAKEIGCTGERLATEHEGLGLVKAKANYQGTCPICKKIVAERFRLKRGMRAAYHVPCLDATGKKEYIIWKRA